MLSRVILDREVSQSAVTSWLTSPTGTLQAQRRRPDRRMEFAQKTVELLLDIEGDT
jgi:hypothetical protein